MRNGFNSIQYRVRYNTVDGARQSTHDGRISELRAKGYDIESRTERDRHGFAYHRLVAREL